MGRSIHVCHLTKYYPPAVGGIESHVQTLARRQAARGWEVSVLCVDHRHGRIPRTSDCESDCGVNVIRLPRRLSVFKWDFCPGIVNRMRALQSGPGRVDLLHLHTPNPTMTLALCGAAVRVPLVVTHHSDVVRQRLLGEALSRVERPLLNRAAKILTTSPNYAEGSKVLRPLKNKVETLPLGIELSPFLKPSDNAFSIRAQLQRRIRGPLWLCVGRLVYYKALHIAVQSMRQLPGQLMIIGSGPLRMELEAEAKSCGVTDRVSFEENVDADFLVAAYHAATALLFPSNARSEGFGLVQVEAMASGCPVINADIPHSGVPWVCPTEVSGITVPINDASAVAAAANRLLHEGGLRDRLATAGKLRAIEWFSAEQMTNKCLEYYDAVIGQKAAVFRAAAN